MQALSVKRIYAEAIQAIARDFLWLLLAALPLLFLHAYVVLLTNPLMRVAFVNSYLKPANALARGGYEIQMLEGFQIVPGPGYSFPVILSALVIVAEFLVFTLFAMIAICRFLKVSSGSPSFVSTVAFGLSVFVLLALNSLLSRVHPPIAHLAPVEWAFPLQMTWTLFVVWLLLMLGTIAPALANDDWHFVQHTFLATLTTEPLRTLALAGLATLTIAAVHTAPHLLERALFEPGSIPLGFRGLHVYALTVIVLREWLQAVLLIALFIWRYVHLSADQPSKGQSPNRNPRRPNDVLRSAIT